MKSRNRAILDTSAVIGLFGGDPRVLAAFERQDLLLLPVITVGELYYGAMRSALRQSNLQRLEDFAKGVHLVECDFETARFYGEIKAMLAAQGSLIPENDCWIAALSSQHRGHVLTLDAHFNKVRGLQVDFIK